MLDKSFISVAAMLVGIAICFSGGPFLADTVTPLSAEHLASIVGGSSYCYVAGTRTCNPNLVACGDTPGDCVNYQGTPMCTLTIGLRPINPGPYDYAVISLTQNGSTGVVNGNPFSCYAIDNCNKNFPCEWDPVKQIYTCTDTGFSGNNSPPVTPRTPDNNPCTIGSR